MLLKKNIRVGNLNKLLIYFLVYIFFSQGRKLGLDSYKKQLTNEVDGLLPFGKLDDWIVKVVDVEQQSNEKIIIRFMLQYGDYQINPYN